MKRIFLYSILALPVLGMAQIKPAAKPAVTAGKVDRTKAPKPGKAPILKIGTPATLTLPNGLKVFVVTNSKLPRVSATLTLDIDPFLEGNKAGYSELAGTLMSHGTTTLNKAKLDEEIDFLGAELSTSSSGTYISSLTSNFNKAFDLFTDVILHPAFDKDEFEKIRKQTLANLESQKDEPDAISHRVVAALEYGKNHPYGENQTAESVKNIQQEDLKKYYTTYWKPNIGYLVFVGDITPAKAFELATKHFGGWAKGDVPKANFVTPKPVAKTIVAIVDRPAAVQSVITLVNPIQLKPGAADVIPSRVMDNILGGGMSSRLFRNLREKHSFTYGAYSSLTSDKWVGSFSADASVRNEKTDSAIGEFINELNRLRNEPVSDSELIRIKNSLNGGFARSLEKPQTIANFALNIARYGLSPDYYKNYLSNLAAVNNVAVKQMANKYILPSNQYIVIVGNAKEIAKGLSKYGEVKYFDMNGKETKAPSDLKAVAPDVTPQSIINKCIEVSGGKASIDALKDVELKGKANIMGQELDFNQKVILKSAFANAILYNGMAMMKQTVIEGIYLSTQQGVPKEMDAQEKEELDEQTYLVEETYYLTKEYSYTVKGVDQVDGKDAYIVEIKSPKGRVFSNYYDIATGFKVKTLAVEDAGPQGSITTQTYFSGYKAYNNVQIPTKILVDQGQMKIAITIDEVKTNAGLGTAEF